MRSGLPGGGEGGAMAPVVGGGATSGACGAVGRPLHKGRCGAMSGGVTGGDRTAGAA